VQHRSLTIWIFVQTLNFKRFVFACF